MNYIEFRLTKDNKLESTYINNSKKVVLSAKDAQIIFNTLEQSVLIPKITKSETEKTLRYYNISEIIKNHQQRKRMKKITNAIALTGSAINLILMLTFTKQIEKTDNHLRTIRTITIDKPELESNQIYLNEINSFFELEIEDNSKSQKVENVKNNYYNIIEKYSNMYGLPVNLMVAMAANESSGDCNAKSNAGAYGLFQIKAEGNWNWLGKNITTYNFEKNETETITVCQNENGIIDSKMLFNPEYNTKVACMILQYNLGLCDYDILCALQTYNYGTKSVKLKKEYNKDWINYRDEYLNDSKYIESVLSFIEQESLILTYMDSEDNVYNVSINNQNKKVFSLNK